MREAVEVTQAGLQLRADLNLRWDFAGGHRLQRHALDPRERGAHDADGAVRDRLECSVGFHRGRAYLRLGMGPRICHHLAMIELREAEGLTVADVMHRHISTLSTSVTVGEVREYFAASASRRVALLADGERYVGSIPATDLPADIDPAGPAAVHAVPGPTVSPQAPAVLARELALAHPTRRVPVVDDSGALAGIIAISKDRSRFCGT